MFSYNKRILQSIFAATLATGAMSSEAATLTGTVSFANAPVAGAIVTAWNAARNRKESVYTDAAGRYKLDTSFDGKILLRGRATNLKDVEHEMTLAANSKVQHDLVLEKLATPEAISEALTASAHAAALPFPDAKTKAAFINQCTYCHQQGNSLTRVARETSAWSKTIRRMEGYGSYVTYGEAKRIADTLHAGFNGKPVTAIQSPLFSPELAHAKVEEWHVAGPLSFLHDTFVGADDQLYGIDEGSDKIYVLDRKTSQIKEYDMPVTDEVKGGAFSGLQLPIGIFTGKHGPHSAAQTSDGRMFITAALSGNIIMFNPATKAWKLYPLPRGFLWRKGLYAHTIRTDKEDNVWFTVMASNMVLKFDTHTEKFTEVALPHNGAMRWLSDTVMGVVLKIAGFFPEQNFQLVLSHHKWLNGGRQIFNWPYGIDINPVDGGIWYSKVLANKIGHIDPKTLVVTEYDVPHKGPRRMRFAPDGTLWIPSYDEGMLMHFDPKTSKFDSIPLPLLAKNEYEIPYALNVNPENGEVWISANNSDRVLRYLPKEKRFIAYPMPSRVVWFRDLEFTKDGKVCASNSNLPAYAHEDHVPAFFCINPNAV